MRFTLIILVLSLWGGQSFAEPIRMGRIRYQISDWNDLDVGEVIDPYLPKGMMSDDLETLKPKYSEIIDS